MQSKFLKDGIRHYIHQELAKLGIEVVGFSSDGDPKLLAAMHSLMFKSGPTFAEEFKDFYFASGDQKFILMQDFIHTVNKFRTRLDPSNYLPLGKFSANQSHLRILMNERTKDEHGLTTSDLDQDKMNFNSSVKICSEQITSLLEKHVPGSEGTVAYLTVMRNVMQAGMDESLSPLEKVYKIWYAVFFFRYWKNWLTQNPKFTLDNFVTRNLYICVEVIAHAIIKLIVKFRQEDCPESLLIHLFTSQACESFFRLLRSLTTTESTVINFAMKELLQKVRRVDMLHNVSSKLAGKLVFPREKRKRLLGVLTADKLKSTYLPSNAEIRTAVMEAKSAAISDLRKLGVTCPRDICLGKIKSCLLACKDFEAEKCSDVPAIYEASVDEDDIPLNLLATFPTPDSVCDINPYADCEGFPLTIKTSHVIIPDGKGGFKSIAKTLLCYMLSSCGVASMNNIRIHRVREKVLNSLGGVQSNRSLGPCKNNDVEVGSWCIFKEKGKFIIGNVLGFKYLSGTGKARSYTLSKAPVEPPKNVKPRGIGCLGTWYSNVGNILKLHASQHNFIDISCYIATIPLPIPNMSGLQLSAEAYAYLLELQAKR